MARMPTAESLSSSEIRSPGVPRQQRDYVGPAIEAAGNVVTRNAEADINLDMRQKSKEKDENNALDLARARADWTTRRLTADEGYQLDKNPRYDKWEQGYNGEIGKHRDESAKIIRDPKLRERFKLETEDDIVRGRFGIRDRARTIDKEKRYEEAFQAIDQNLALAVKADPKEAGIIIENARKDIDNLALAGVITPARAVQMRQTFAKKYASLKIAQDIEDDPKKAAAYLDGAKGGPVGIIRKFEGYRSRPYWDVNAYRVGYGSDTVTYADGTVVKVKPGMSITREDAERDLQRRIGEFQAGIVRDVGPDAWGSLSPAAKSALTSVAYNYGSLPGSVVNAIKGGNPAQIAAAVAGLKDHNGGINAKRRAEEANMIASGVGDDMTAPDYYSVIDPEDRMRLSTAAEGEWQSREIQQKETSALDRYQIKSQVEDDIAQITETGKASDIDPQKVVDTLGETEAAKWLENRDVAVKTYEAVSIMDNMTEDQINDHLDSLEPSEGAGFANSQKIYEKAEAKAKKLLDLRMKDPAMAVEDSRIVQTVKHALSPDDPLAQQKIVRARMVVQQRVGIPSAMQQPVTRAEARRIIAPIQSVLDMMDATIVASMGIGKTDAASRRANAKAARQEAENQIRETVDQIEAVYGPYAPKVLAFAIAESVRDKEIGDLASGVLRKIAKGEQPTITETKGMEDAADASIAEKAVTGQLPKPEKPVAQGSQTPAPQPVAPGFRTGKAPNRSGGGDVKPREYAQPSGRAIDRLMANPNEAALFDGIYGPGAAARYLKKE